MAFLFEGILRGLVVTTPGSQIWVRLFESLLGPQNSGLAWLLYKYAASWRIVYGPSAPERPLGTICKEKGIAYWFWVSISSRYDLSCRKRRKTPELLSFLSLQIFSANHDRHFPPLRWVQCSLIKICISSVWLIDTRHTELLHLHDRSITIFWQAPSGRFHPCSHCYVMSVPISAQFWDVTVLFMMLRSCLIFFWEVRFHPRTSTLIKNVIFNPSHNPSKHKDAQILKTI